ncbi:MAG: metallophosphoesterase [Lachnospiraceae bacterium]|nr:metallophosphoesterase [Lachnospiraceae bacterium]
MIMWMLIFAGMFLLMLIGVIYIISRLCKTEFIKGIANGNKQIERLIAAAAVIILLLIGYRLLDMINIAIVAVHTLFVWILLDLVRRFILKGTHKSISQNAAVLINIVLLILYFIWGWYGAHHIVATNYNLQTEKTDEKLRIVQISDSHIGATFDGNGFAEAVKTIQKENPDVVVITGDFVDDGTSKEDMVIACEALGTLETKYGVYFVFGNHDKGYSNEERGYDAAELVRNLELHGVKVLEDETVEIGESYYLIGRQDRSEESMGGTRASMDELMQDLDPNRYMIVLDHQPNDFANQERNKVDLVLSGHTHGGQFFPINRLGELTGQNDMTYGIRKQGETTFEVSSGISDWAIKFKTGCKAEYVVIDVE